MSVLAHDGGQRGSGENRIDCVMKFAGGSPFRGLSFPVYTVFG